MAKFDYRWTLKDAIFTKDKGSVFSCFSCGGGSSFGYKLAGFDVIGCNEIDPKMMEVYKINHNPKYSYLEPIQTFKNRTDLPEELYNLDILDGSPPCSSFSMAGNREKDWGKEKVFREGQSEQVLDTLFFDFIELGKKLQPKVIIAENVKGIMMGEAWQYMRKIYADFEDAGYYVQHFLLDASKMGVPQRRERVFFIALRKDLAGQFLQPVDMFNVQPELKLKFNEQEIIIDNVLNQEGDQFYTNESDLYINYFNETESGEVIGKFQSGCRKMNKLKVCNTITASGGYTHFHPEIPRQLSKLELCNIGTFPVDYDFNSTIWHYLIGMSVPPVMAAKIATEIHNQWLSKL